MRLASHFKVRCQGLLLDFSKKRIYNDLDHNIEMVIFGSLLTIFITSVVFRGVFLAYIGETHCSFTSPNSAPATVKAPLFV